jgi:hypothetical protein
MAVSKNLNNLRRSSRGRSANKPSEGGWGATALCFVVSLAVMAAAVAYFYKTGAILYSGDAEAHLNIARRVIDSRVPGWVQLGTTWLPLPHLMMIPFVRDMELWRTGLGGAIPSAICMALGSTFLFASIRRIFDDLAAAAVGAAVFLLNPNTLYLGSIPMTEPALYASLFALLYFTVRFGDTQGWGAVTGAALAACAGSLTRYEAWFLLPFAALYICLKGGEKRWPATVLFCALAGAGPVLWLLHNWWYFEDALYFYRGPWSAKAIQGKLPYPGRGDWRMAAHYFFEAGRLVVGLPGLVVAGAGCLLAATKRRAHWALFLLFLTPAFYVWSIHSSGTPVFVPHLEPHGWYNVRYAMAFLPLLALGGAALVSLAGTRFGKPAAVLVVVAALGPFLYYWNSHAITWQEAEINSRGRREWTAQAVQFLRAAAGPHETFFTSFNDMTAIYRTLGIPLRDTLTGDINPQFLMVQSRPDLFLWEDWAIVMGGDTVQGIVDKARLRGPHFELSDRIFVKGQPVIEIYHKIYENPLL